MAQILWLASYPKSGNTWVRIFLHNYLLNPAEPQDINKLDLVTGDSNHFWYEKLSSRKPTEISPDEVLRLRPQVQVQIAAAREGDVLAKTHFPLHGSMGQQYFDLRVSVGAVYVVRNPIDVCLSLAKFWGANYDRMISGIASDEFCGKAGETNVWEKYGNWSKHVESWTATDEDGVLVLRYEDLKQHPQESFGRLAGFFEGKQPDPNRVEKAVDFSDFKRLKSVEINDGFKEQAETGRAFFRKGLVGEGSRELDSRQIDRIVKDHGEVMEKFGYLP